MNTVEAIHHKQDGYVKNSTLLLLAFASAFFPRIFNSLGFPSTINFVHFAIVPLVCGIIISTTRVRDKSQTSAAKALLLSIFILFGVMTASALLNQAGLINVFIALMLLAEPFIVLLAIISIPLSPKRLKRFRFWLLGFAGVNLFLALAQHFLISAGILRVSSMQPPDNVQGVFYLSGSGHVISTCVSMSFALYYFVSAKGVSIWIRAAVFFTVFLQLLFADAKQVLLVWLIAWLLLILIKLNDARAILQYLIGAILISYGLFWCIQNLEAFSAFQSWIRPELYGPDGAATLLKMSPFRIIPTFYESPLNWLLGLGPGHTIGRLGGWMLKDYAGLLRPLGATIHPASEAVWAVYRGNWLDSTFFTPLWSWAGVWGDFGFLGLAAYLCIYFIVWHRFCLTDSSKFTLLTVVVFGFVVAQLEEPGYMLSMASIIGLQWQELQVSKQSRLLASIQSPNTENQAQSNAARSYIKQPYRRRK